MLLKKSFVYRNSAHSGSTSEIDANWSLPPTGDRDSGIELRFDMGTEGKKERLAVHIHRNDFALIASIMMEADREVAIKAFGKALAKSKPQD
ncbi:hypothetical protein [Agrobacterium tumefaciens]|uniref:hypothetical protein n=1 Tax=Agrobacterium tumefaciens TaxID=358 RepID=UPI002789EB3C|nr:hypothetical protein [Agrobacterium tumefaciens]MDP9854528.1 hypothetical protein [Agrobacterium tumefaciens]